MDKWTPSMVEERLIEAADVLAGMPSHRVQGFYSLWPDMAGQASRQSPIRPSPDAIDRMEVTLGWFKWLKPEDVKLVWARAENVRWKIICWRMGISRATASLRFRYAISVITCRLNGRTVHAKRSRRFVIEQCGA